MSTHTLTIIIYKPIAEVFAFCITPPKVTLWAPGFIDESTNEWPVRVGTVYTEYKDDDTSFNIIVTDFKQDEYIEWKTEDGAYHVRYMFEAVDLNSTRLTYVETGDVDEPFSQDALEKLKDSVEKS